MFKLLSPLFQIGPLSVSWVLVGLAAAAIPLIIHLSRSRRTKKMRFSTTRFFTDQFLRSYRMSRLKELLLLACRMALCAFFAMALAKPHFQPQGQAALPGQSRAVVLVLDNSASMGYVEEGTSLFDRARAAARELIDGLRPGDTASVVLACRRDAGPEVLFPQPTPELGDVHQALDTLKVAALGTDLTGALARAEAIVQGSNAQSKEIYVLSDLQKSGWQPPDEENTPRGDSDVLTFLVRIAPKSRENVALTAVNYAAARPMVGVPFWIWPHLHVQGDRVQSCTVGLFIDGQKVAERRVDKLQADRWVVPRFRHTFTTGGWHSGYVEVQDDTLAVDNRRYFAFEVLDTIKVLAVNGAPSEVPRLDELFFLKAALTASAEGKSSIQLDVISPASLAQADLGNYPLVILANVESLTPAAVEKLEGFVDPGGSLLVFLGGKINPAFYNQTFAAPTRLHEGLLPGRLLELEGDPGSEKNLLFVGEVDFGHPVLSDFQDPKFASLSGVHFKALWKVDPGPSMVLMRASSGSPLLCEKRFGKGRVLLFTSTCDRDWTNFPVRPAFLPWVYRLVGDLARERLERQGTYLTGEHVPLRVSAARGASQVLVKKPNGTVGYATTSDDPAAPLEFTDTAQPGVYTLYTSGKPEASQFFAVNLEGRESDLTYKDEELAERTVDVEYPSVKAKIEAGFKDLLPHRPQLYYVDDPDRTGELALNARGGVKLWDYLLAGVLMFALFEPWFANRISLRHYGRPEVKAEAAGTRAGRWSRLARWREAGTVAREGGAL
jgi:hypothetical protein